MRALFSCLPGLGHFHPMVPLAQAWTDARHDVAFATAERFGERVVGPAGFEVWPAGLSPQEVEEKMRAADLTDQAPTRSPDAVAAGARMFAGVAGPAKVADLVRVIDAWRPDLVVHDSFDFGAPVAAARARLPWAGHSFGALQPTELWDQAAGYVAPTWREWGVEPGPAGGMFRHLYLDICPPSLQSPHIADIAAAHRLRPAIFDAPPAATLPAWVDQLPAAPTVYITLGTVFNHTAGLFETVLAGLAAEPINVVVTVGRDRDPAELGEQPGNVRVERYVPQSLLFPHCDVVVCHGGSGTTLAALAHGLPLLILPQGANQHWNGERCAALGAGITLAPSPLTADAVRTAVRRLLGEPAHRAAARRVRAEIDGMPGPEVAVGLLEKLARPAPSLQ